MAAIFLWTIPMPVIHLRGDIIHKNKRDKAKVLLILDSSPDLPSLLVMKVWNLYFHPQAQP